MADTDPQMETGMKKGDDKKVPTYKKKTIDDNTSKKKGTGWSLVQAI